MIDPDQYYDRIIQGEKCPVKQGLCTAEFKYNLLLCKGSVINHVQAVSKV